MFAKNAWIGFTKCRLLLMRIEEERMDAIRSHKNILTEKIDSIDYTHLLGYPSEVVAVEIITMVKDAIGSEVNMKETNMEHFRGEIEKAGHDFAFINGKVEKCNMCKKCDFETGPDEAWESCTIRKTRWLMSEYKSEPVLTAREKHFVECLEDGWLTKGSASNEFKWWGTKPRREGEKWVSDEGSTIHRILSYAFGIKLPFITHEDEEPWSVEELRKLKALEYNPEDVAFKAGDLDA